MLKRRNNILSTGRLFLPHFPFSGQACAEGPRIITLLLEEIWD